MQRPEPRRSRAVLALASSVCVLALGIALAARSFPGGFDWPYMVMSALASRKHNPGGSVYFSLGLALALAALWPALRGMRRRGEASQRLVTFGVRALRTGIVFGVLVGLERTVFFHVSDVLRKSHEALATVSFVSLYAGVVALYVDRIRRGDARWQAALAISPLVAIGASQLGLYLDQRDLGWVGRDWRDMGVPVWWSFAFWQWLSVVALWASIGHLSISAGSRPEEGGATGAAVS